MVLPLRRGPPAAGGYGRRRLRASRDRPRHPDPAAAGRLSGDYCASWASSSIESTPANVFDTGEFSLGALGHACGACALASATAARARAGSRTPATGRRRAARAASGRPRDRSWRAACDPAARAFPPARPGARRRRRRSARHRRTASPCTPRSRHRSAGRQTVPPPQHRRRRGTDPPTTDLTRLSVQRVEGDRRSMHVKPGYDRHQGPPPSSGDCLTREPSRAEPKGPQLMPSLREERR
jgi:hypothetical protein